MKIKIEYDYKLSNNFPFVACAKYNETWFSAVSNFSFDEAKAELIAKIENAIKQIPTVIPEPEEIEL